jgi:hypothetical protein
MSARPLLVDAPGVAGIAAANDLVDEAPPGSEIISLRCCSGTPP